MLVATVIRASVEMDFGDRATLLPSSLRFMIAHAFPNAQELVVSPVFDEEKRHNVPLPRSLMERTDRYALFLIRSQPRGRNGEPRPAHGQVFRDDHFGKSAIDLTAERILELLADERPWLELLKKASGRDGQRSFVWAPAAHPLVLQICTCESNPQNVAIFSFFRNGR